MRGCDIMHIVIFSTVRVFPKLAFSTLLLLLVASAQAQLTVTIGQNFQSSTINSAGSIPADANGAIGPHHYIEFINGTVAVYNRTNAVRVQRKTNVKFWADAGVLVSSDSTTTDPRVIYDPASQRWFATQVDASTAVADPTTQANDFLVAVSTTDNPAGTWHGFSFQSDPDTGAFADFPTMGIDSDAVYISGDFFQDGESNPIGSGLVSIPKADLLASTPTIDNRTWFGISDYTVHGQVLQPAICVDGSTHGNIISLSDIGSTSDPISNLVAFAVQNATTATATLSPVSFLDVAPFSIPDNADLGEPLLTPTQPDGTHALMANDARFAGCVRAVNGVLYAVHSTEYNGKIAIRWYRINATTQTLIESGTIADPNLDLFFPSIAVNSSGVVVICCNGCSTSTYISSFAIAGLTRNGVTSFQSPVLLASGTISYHDDFEQLADILEIPPLSRWGDYSATSPDPNDPNRFWTIQMIPIDVDVWATQVTEVIVSAPPQLSVALSNNNAVVSWPAAATGFALQSTSNVGATNWSTVTQNRSTNNGTIFYTTPLGSVPAFFRLKL
ncbi:MAG: hypothetical protein JWO95_735 [Verrucomicrobiales bacterium]|nr:hypothetical protein [Verrucomicrobiales bacterium]